MGAGKEDRAVIKTIFLDLDDTILDFSMAEAAALRRALLEAGIPPEDRILERYHHINAAQWALLEEGKTVAYITLGDPSIYSTYLYIHRRVLAMGYEARLIPGVPSFCAVAAALGTGLCEGSDRLLIVPASHRDVADCLAVDANLVFMKAGKDLGALRDRLARERLLENASLAANCGMEGEVLCPRLSELEEETGYFSLVVVKRGEK